MSGRRYTPGELRAVLEAHGKWRRGEPGGSRADLADADLAGADLAGADLARAYLARANLADAYLADAYLADAYLAGAYLADADLADADLADADLAGADLAGANLADAYLARANLAGANLADADLADADLADAYLARANLADAYLARANLAGANLADADLADADLADAYLARANLAGAYLARANLADAYLADADLAGATMPEPAGPRAPFVLGATPDYAGRAARYRERHPDVPDDPQLDAAILQAVTTGGGKLHMDCWHTCDTTHCRAGWAIHLAGKAGYALEERLGDPQRAGAAIYRASTGRVPDFFASDERAMEDIEACAAEQAAPERSKDGAR